MMSEVIKELKPAMMATEQDCVYCDTDVLSEMCFVFVKKKRLIHQCWKIPCFSRWQPSIPCGHTKWKINCFYKMECLNQLVIIYAES